MRRRKLLFLWLLQHGGNIIIYISKAPAEHQDLPWPEEGEWDTVTQSLSWVTILAATIWVVPLSPPSSLRAALVLTPWLHEALLVRDWGACPGAPDFKIWMTFSKPWNKCESIPLKEKRNCTRQNLLKYPSHPLSWVWQDFRHYSKYFCIPLQIEKGNLIEIVRKSKNSTELEFSQTVLPLSHIRSREWQWHS